MNVGQTLGYRDDFMKWSLEKLHAANALPVANLDLAAVLTTQAQVYATLATVAPCRPEPPPDTSWVEKY